MKEFAKKYRHFFVIVFIILLTTIIIIPALINILFKLKAPNAFWAAEWQAADVLSYYGAILSFLGTGLLSLLALWQNYTLNKANEKHTALLEQMQRDLHSPHFVVENCVVLGSAYHLQFSIKNISDNIAQEFSISDFSLVNSHGASFWSNPEKFCVHYLGPSMTKTFELTTPGITELDTLLVFRVTFVDIFGTKCERKATGFFSDGIQNLHFLIQK